LVVLFSLVAWVADNPRPQSSTFHSVVAETGNRWTDEWPYFVFWSRTLRHISAVRYLCTFCNRNTFVYLKKKKPDSQAIVAELCQTSKKQAKQWHFLHSTPQTVVNFQGHIVHISVIESNVSSMLWQYQ